MKLNYERLKLICKMNSYQIEQLLQISERQKYVAERMENYLYEDQQESRIAPNFPNTKNWNEQLQEG